MKRIELYLNDLFIDIGSNEIAASYAIADMTNIQTRQSNRSIELQIPLTARNRKHLQNIQIVNNASRLPYQVLSARIYVEGVNMNLTKGVIRKVKDSFFLRLYGGNINFYDFISPLSISDCNLSEYDHDWTYANIQTHLNDSEGMFYPIVNYGRLSNVFNRIDCERLFPSVYSHSILRAMIADAGYTCAGDLFEDPDFLLDCLPFSNNRTRYSQAFVDKHNGTIGLSADETNTVGVVTAPDYYKVTLDEIVSDPGSHFTFDVTLNQYVYVPDKNYRAAFHIKLILLDAEFLGVFDYRVKVFRDGDVNPLAEWYGETGELDGGNYGVRFDKVSEYVDVNAGDKIYLEANIYASGTVTNHNTIIQGGLDPNGVHFSFMQVLTDDAGPSFGDFWEAAANLPDIKQPDFLRYVVQEFGAIIHVNDIKNIITVNKFTRLISNKTIAKDWSEKVVGTRPEISYQLNDYAQVNHCTYLDDDSVVKPDGTDEDIVLDNETLVAEKNLFTAPFAASSFLVRLKEQIEIAVVDLTGDIDATYVDDDDDDMTPKVLNIDYQRMKSVKPRILHLSEYTVQTGFNLAFYSEETYRFTSPTFFRPFFVDINESFSLGWKYLIPKHSQHIVDILQNYRIINESMRLNETDINQLDHFIPVWIERHKSFFYISMIDQYLFTRKSPTSVMLVKI